MRMMRSIFILTLSLFITCYALAPPKVTSELLFPLDTFPYAHVCSVVEADNGDVIAVYHAGTGEGHSDVKVYLSRRDNDTWVSPEIAIDRHGKCVGNPNIYRSPNGTLFLMFHSGGEPYISPDQCKTHWWKGFISHSTDQGETWSNYTAQPDGILGSIKNNCIMLSNGEVLCPSSTESVAEHLIGIWESHMETTDQNMEKWTKRSNIKFFFSEVTDRPCQGPIQPTLFEVVPGRVLALLRTSCGVLAQATSYDFGHTWPEFAESTHIANPGSGVDGVSFIDQDDIGLLLAFNNATWHRTPLTLAHSLDEGQTWDYIVDLETDEKGSYAYPYLYRSRFSDRVAHLCYTYHDREGKRGMKYSRLEFGE